MLHPHKNNYIQLSGSVKSELISHTFALHFLKSGGTLTACKNNWIYITWYFLNGLTQHENTVNGKEGTKGKYVKIQFFNFQNGTAPFQTVLILSQSMLCACLWDFGRNSERCLKELKFFPGSHKSELFHCATFLTFIRMSKHSWCCKTGNILQGCHITQRKRFTHNDNIILYPVLFTAEVWNLCPTQHGCKNQLCTWFMKTLTTKVSAVEKRPM